MRFCEYANIAGAPGTGVHSWRIFDIAVVDVVGTILIAVLLAKTLRLPLVLTLVSLFTLGVIAHRLFCVRTTVDKLLFKD